MNNSLMFSSKSENWSTPYWLFHRLNQVFRFDLDVAASVSNAKCAKYYSVYDDALSRDWGDGTWWCNPPYGRNIDKWVRKAARESVFYSNGVMLLPARTDTQWMDMVWRSAAVVCFLRGRLRFGGSDNSAPFPSMLAVYKIGWPTENELELLDTLGTVVKVC